MRLSTLYESDLSAFQTSLIIEIIINPKYCS
jgi:hypothetical protein